MNETHDPNLRSWVESANGGATDFPIQNLPFGIFSRGDEAPRAGIAIGEMILDVSACVSRNLLPVEARPVGDLCADGTLNSVMQASPENLSAFRRAVSALLAHGSPSSTTAGDLLVPMSEATLHLPAHIGDYTDFYASIYHATNVGRLFRPDSPLLPNYKYLPIGYHGRASSLVPAGTPVRRPFGQTRPGESGEPAFIPSKALDYEAEVGFFVGRGNERGTRIAIGDAQSHIFGFCLVNDWSARDIQAWEYQPLGPFLGKNFATSVSPWVLTMEALEPFRSPAFFRPEGDPRALPYLSAATDSSAGGLDLTLEVLIRSRMMREAHLRPARVSLASFTDMYWTPAQMITHHSSNGCNLRSGDLLASGTVSGPDEGSQGCLLELTRRGAQPITLPSGEERSFLHDGDEVILRGWFEREGAARIGTGDCTGEILPAAPN